MLGAVCYPERAHDGSLQVIDPTQSGDSGAIRPPVAVAGGKASRGARMEWLRAQFIVEAPWEFVVLIAVGLFLLMFGLAPRLGGDQLGLVGADEPRYAQVAREMLAAHNDACSAVHAEIVPRSYHWADIHASEECLLAGTVTPVLYGKPWLEKPALYYWRAMGFFREFGVSDWSARLPSTSGAAFLVFLIFLHMRRFRPGGHLGRGVDYGFVTRAAGVLAGRVDGYAAGGAVLHRHAGLVCVVRDGKEVLAVRPVFFWRGGNAGKGSGRAVPGAGDDFPVYRAAAGVDAAAKDDLATRTAAVLCNGAAVVHRGAATESDVL